MNIHELDLNNDSFSVLAKFGEPEVEILPFWRRNLAIKKTMRKKPYLWNKSRRQFSYAARCFMPKLVVHQTAPVWFVKNECFMAKIDVYRSLLASDHVIGWDFKITSLSNSNASFINIWDRLIWRRSPDLTRSSKLATAPNCTWVHNSGEYWHGCFFTPVVTATGQSVELVFNFQGRLWIQTLLP